MRNQYNNISIDGKRIGEHRHVVEQCLGRKLLENEVVHHKNGKRYDNRIENLQVMDKSEHSQLSRTLPIKRNSSNLYIKSQKALHGITSKRLSELLGISLYRYLEKEKDINKFTGEEYFIMAKIFKLELEQFIREVVIYGS